MKKGTLIRNIIVSVFIVEFCLGAFFLSFLSSLKISNGGDVIIFKNIVWGCTTLTANGQEAAFADFIGVQSSGFAVVPGIGLLLILFASIAAALITWLVKKPFAKWIVVGLAAIILVGAIMQFFTYDAFIRAFVNELAKQAGVYDKATIEEAINSYKQSFAQFNPQTVIATVTGVFGIVGALGVAVPNFIPEKK